MGIMAGIIGGIGGLVAVLGVTTIFGVMPFNEQFTWAFWFNLSIILLLSSIAISVGRGGGYAE